MKLKCVFLLLIVSLFFGCKTVPREYSYSPGLPDSSFREDNWEGFASPATTEYEYDGPKDIVSSTNNPDVLWIIADTYGDDSEMDEGWKNEASWFFDPERTRFVEPSGTSNERQHWHGFGCYSCGWPTLYGIPNVDYILFRMVDVTDGAQKLINLLEIELEEYKGRVVLSNSWGVPRQNNDNDSFSQIIWKPWVEKMEFLMQEYPAFTIVFSSGNSGPTASGFPQSMIKDAILVGATDKMGRIADFSSPSPNIFGVAGGHRKYVANPEKAGEYMIVSGTSFSCPTIASIIAKYMAENPEKDREDVLNFLRSNAVPPIDYGSFNAVWGHGELEQLNQNTPEYIWRDLGFPKGISARIRGWVSPTKMVDLPRPMQPSMSKDKE